MSKKKSPPPDLQKLLDRVKGKRAKIVAEHIVKHGAITTEDLRNTYGYEHPPRAKQDLQEQGIPIETSYVKNDKGRRIAAYRFGDLSAIRRGRFGGRKAFPKKFKEQIVEHQGARCAICSARLEKRYLQIDHRVPYEVTGDTSPTERKTEEFMLVCASCNRAKSWSCEHCPNWLDTKDPLVCKSCYWASPESYKHIALTDIRRLDILWAGEEIVHYERLAERARKTSKPLPDFVKAVLARALNGFKKS